MTGERRDDAQGKRTDTIFSTWYPRRPGVSYQLLDHLEIIDCINGVFIMRERKKPGADPESERS